MAFPCGDLNIPYKDWPETSKRSLEQTFTSLLTSSPELQPLIQGLVDLHEQSSRLEFANYVAIEDWLKKCLSTGGIPTVFVAASNGPAREQAIADYVCTGTDDQTTINQAVADKITPSGFGRLVLGTGLFSISGTLDFNNPSNLSILGMGLDQTIIKTASGSPAFIMFTDVASTGLTIENITLDGNSICTRLTTNTVSLTTRPIFNGIKVNGFTDIAFNDLGPGILVHNSFFSNCGTAIHFDVDGHETVISNTRFENCTYGLISYGGLSKSRIIGCHFDAISQVAIDNAGSQLVMLGNVIEGSCSIKAIRAGQGSIIANNQIINVTGIGIETRANDALIFGNFINGFGSAGVYCRGPATGSAAHRPRIIGNVIRDTTGNAIELTSDINDALIVGNDLRGGATPIIDSGTGTLTSWPSHATYGDNFT